MAKAKPSVKNLPAATADVTESNVVTTTEDGYTDTLNPDATPAKTAQDLKSEAALAKIAIKAEKKAAADNAKAEREAAKLAKAGVNTAEREAAKLERAARIEALKAEGKNYVGSMLALADRVKQGIYVKSATGQLRSTDELAVAFDGVGPLGVVQVAMFVLGEEANKYAALNIGQQSMNYRNRLRGAVTKGTVTLDQIKEAIVTMDVDGTEQIQKANAEKAAAKAKRELEAKAKKVQVVEVPAEAATEEPEEAML